MSHSEHIRLKIRRSHAGVGNIVSIIMVSLYEVKATGVGLPHMPLCLGA